MSAPAAEGLASRAALGTPRPLAGITVVGLEQFIAGPCATMWLADAGARVIKVEPPEGDPARRLGPFAEHEGQMHSGFYARFNRGKEIVHADLRSDEGRQQVLELVATADVVVDNFRPGVLERLGLGYEVIRAAREDVIYCSVTGFGVDPETSGPYSDFPALDIVVQAMGGLMTLCGEAGGPPLYPGFGIGDVGSSMFATMAILEALVRRERTGQGARLDVAMYDSMVALNERAMTTFGFVGEVLQRGEANLAAPWGPFKTSDGFVALIVPTDEMWRRACEVMELPQYVDDPRTATTKARVANRDTVTHPLVAEWCATRTAGEVVETFVASGVPCGRIQDAADIAACPQVAARGLLWQAEGAAPPAAFVVGKPFRFVGEGEVDVPTIPLDKEKEDR
ncbi:MAG TPA: CoA transferase [Solirubrobacterales bacterium]|nr:CoA transferase [Solirubrobacterales bacterium]